MRYVNKVINILLLVTLFVFVASPVNAQADKIYKELVDTLNLELETYEQYVKFTEEIPNIEPDSLVYRFTTETEAWRGVFNKSNNIYLKHLNNNDSKIALVAETAFEGSSYALQALDEYDYALSGTLEEYEADSSLTEGDRLFNLAVTKHDKAVDLYNEYSGYNNQEENIVLLYFSTFVSFILSLGLFIKTKNKLTYESDLIKTKIYQNLFTNSLWLFIGLLITTVTYHFASIEGGTYYILYGPVIFGGWKLLSGLWIYFTKDRKILNEIKQEQRKKLLKDLIT